MRAFKNAGLGALRSRVRSARLRRGARTRFADGMRSAPDVVQTDGGAADPRAVRARRDRTVCRAADVETLLAGYYRAARTPANPAQRRAAVQATARETRRLRAAPPPAVSRAQRLRRFAHAAAEALAFVAAQARFMSVRSWALQACSAAAAVLLAATGPDHAAAGLYACFAAAAVAVCGLPEVAAARSYGVLELERSCKHGARSVAAARMAVLACANAAAIAVVAACASYGRADMPFAFALVCAFAPYCVTVAGSLVAARRIDGQGALAAAAAWASAVVAAAYFAASRAPWLYTQAALGIWAMAAALAFAWAALEARSWLADAAHSARPLSFDSSYLNR